MPRTEPSVHMCVPFMGTRLTSRVTREEGAARKKMDQMYGAPSMRRTTLERATLSLDANDSPRIFLPFLSFSSSSFFFFFSFFSSFLELLHD